MLPTLETLEYLCVTLVIHYSLRVASLKTSSTCKLQDGGMLSRLELDTYQQSVRNPIIRKVNSCLK